MTNQTTRGAPTAIMGSPAVLTIGASALATPDLNQDGKPDLVVVGGTSGPDYTMTATAFINTTVTGAPGVSFAPGVTFSGSSYASGSLLIAVGDLNGDGKPDLVLFESEVGVSPQRPSSISALVNTTVAGAPTPTFAPAITLGTVNGAGVALVDIDRNGTLDVLIAHNGPSGALSLLSNQTVAGAPTLTFAAPVDIPLHTTLNEVSTIAVGDVNGDGIPDLVVPDVNCQASRCDIAVLVNETAVAGAPTLVETTIDLVAPANVGPYRGDLATMSFADVDGDGALDLVFNDGYLETLYNATTPGSDTASFPVQRFVYSTLGNYGIESFVLADLNGDSFVDLVGCYESAVGVSMQR
jgi:hypothetical protein